MDKKKSLTHSCGKALSCAVIGNYTPWRQVVDYFPPSAQQAVFYSLREANTGTLA